VNFRKEDAVFSILFFNPVEIKKTTGVSKNPIDLVTFSLCDGLRWNLCFRWGRRNYSLSLM